MQNAFSLSPDGQPCVQQLHSSPPAGWGGKNWFVCRFRCCCFRCMPLCQFFAPFLPIPASVQKRNSYFFRLPPDSSGRSIHLIHKVSSCSTESLHVSEIFSLQIIRHLYKFIKRHRPRDVVNFHRSVQLLFLRRSEVITGQSAFPALTVHMGICPSRNALFLHDVIVKIIHRQLCTPPCADSLCRTVPGFHHGLR